MARKAPMTVREAALRMLSRREHSRGELRRKLREKFGADETGAIEEELSRLEESGFLSDERFARAYARGVSSRFGARRIRMELKKRGVGEEEIELALAEVGMDGDNAEDELSRAREMAARRRRIGESDSESARKENARLARWLVARGFSFETARKATTEAED